MELTLNQIGLLLDIAGVVVLFFFGLPSKIREQDVFGREENNSDKFRRIIAHIGLLLLIVGFIVQYASNNQT